MIGIILKFISAIRVKSCGMDPPGLENLFYSFLSSGSKVVEGPPMIGKIFKFISEFRIKSCGMDPP